MRRIICLAAALTLAGALFAQQSLMSQRYEQDNDHYWKLKYLFTGEADWYMDPNDYGKVEMESVFAEAGATRFLNDNGDPINNQAAGGFGAKLGGIYLGAFADLNMGQDDSFGFTEQNEIQAMIGTGSFGAFKGFAKRDADGCLVGLGWGMNFPGSGSVLKPEFMLGYYSVEGPDTGVDGYLDAGASLDVELAAAENYTSSIQTNYEIRFGMPTDDDAGYQDHKAALLYQRLYTVTENLDMGWGLGANGTFKIVKDVAGNNTKTLAVNAEAVGGFAWSLNEMFGITGQLFFNYPISQEDKVDNANPPAKYKETIIGGPQLRPVVGGVFRPHPKFAIEMRCAPGQGLGGGVNPTRFDIMATLKK